MFRSKTQSLLRYLDLFVSAGPFDELEQLFHPSLRFRGPLFSSDTAAAYVDALRKEPPEGVDYTLISSFESAEQAVMIIDFVKPPKRVPMAVWAKFSGDKIAELRLIFDSQALR